MSPARIKCDGSLMQNDRILSVYEQNKVSFLRQSYASMA